MVNAGFELVGPPERPHIRIADYDPQWRTRYAAHAAAITAALGNRLLQLEHIGSTSVPGLGAKPIVDILVVVEDAADESSYLPQLECAGYALRLRESSFDEHRMLRPVDRGAHVHVFPRQSGEIERYLLLRDLLRRDAQARTAYEAEKRRLATQDWDSMDDYAMAKTDIIEALILRARGET
jgi:GrpB-like predicted nucleotidyltransferase (UPF0157 family)